MQKKIPHAVDIDEDDSCRFSVFLLERDVLEYVRYKNKYNYYFHKNTKMTTPSHLFVYPFMKKKYQSREKYYYQKYIQKMHHLETHYRKINIYTQFHSQLENTKVAFAKYE